MKRFIWSAIIMTFVLFLSSCGNSRQLKLDRSEYQDRLRAFWLSESIANWTGLQTEGERTWIPYLTDDDWEDYGFILSQSPWWSADDDTDIEYIYQHALETYETEILTPEQIRDQWLEHISEDYIWVSNESAYYLMKDEGLLPPETSLPANNPNWEQIDAQLTTEIFGLFAPGRPDVALEMGDLPVRVTAYGDAEMAAKFYIIMHSLAPYAIENIGDENGDGDPYDEQVFWLAAQARAQIPDESYIAGMFDWVLKEYDNNPDKDDWEATRDAFHYAYIEGGADEYQFTNWWDAGSNFGLSLISLMYGEGDLPRTVQIGSLAGMDSDNPTATWGGLLGFLYGYEGVQQAYDYYESPDGYWIGRTRIKFPTGLDDFTSMAARGIEIVDRVVTNQMGGRIKGDTWIIPAASPNSGKIEYNAVVSDNTAAPMPGIGQDYYIDSGSGDDSNSGTNENSPWKTLDKVSSMTFQPGDNIYFKRGSSYDGGVTINGNGTASNPITISAYGTGNAPSFTNSRYVNNKGNAMRIRGDYHIVENLYFHHCAPAVGGDVSFEQIWSVGALHVSLGNDHVIIRNNEFANNPKAIQSYSQYSLITHNYIHDVNSSQAGGWLSEPYWGPIGIQLGIGNQEVSFNTIENMYIVGGEWGGDGGAIEIDDGRNHKDNIHIHHNTTYHNMGFLEVSYWDDIAKMSSSNITIDHNVSRDYQDFVLWWAPTSNSAIESNTIIRTDNQYTGPFDGVFIIDAPPADITLTKNIIVTDNDLTEAIFVESFDGGVSDVTHTSNCHLDVVDGNINLGLPFGPGEIEADPLFVDWEDGDYHLQPDSPAAGWGALND